MKKFFLLFFLISYSIFASAQSIQGRISHLKEKKTYPIKDASVNWINRNTLVLSDSTGHFVLPDSGIKDRRIIIQAFGFRIDTIPVDSSFLPITLEPSTVLKAVNVGESSEGTFLSQRPIKTEIITSLELKKAACCNLGESFETNPTVDVTVKDAVFGSKELQIMGLSGAYTQLLTENTPLISGLGLTYGLNYIPGTQINSISIVKGPGSVQFGPESMSGLVNVELKDPAANKEWFVNGYFDAFTRKELNIDKALRINEHWSGLISTHIDDYEQKLDRNKDSFVDMPFLRTSSILSKWKYSNRGFFSQNSIKYLREERAAGQINFDFKQDSADLFAYGQKLKTERIEAYGRTGFVFRSAQYQSLGLVYSFVDHDQKGFYGLRSYEGLNRTGYLRLLYNRNIGKNHQLVAGASLRSEQMAEIFDTLLLNKNEFMPGILIEDTYEWKHHLAIVSGIRADYLSGNTFITPRATAKYSFTEKSTLRASIGSGFRTSNVLAENPAILSSNRRIVILGPLNPERSLNYGLSFNQEFKLSYRKASIGFDLYRTVFSNKIIPDYETDFQAVLFRNLGGHSYADNVQVETSWKIAKLLTLKMAYKYLDVYVLDKGIKIDQPYIAKHRGLTTLYYESFNRKWTANFGWHWIGKKRLPALDPYHSIHEEIEYRGYSPEYSLFNFQLSRKWKYWEAYAGIDNIFDFRQQSHILSADDPYSKYFDSSYVWGPLDGRRIYTGFRWYIH